MLQEFRLRHRVEVDLLGGGSTTGRGRTGSRSGSRVRVFVDSRGCAATLDLVGGREGLRVGDDVSDLFRETGDLVDEGGLLIGELAILFELVDLRAEFPDLGYNLLLATFQILECGKEFFVCLLMCHI